MSTAAQLTANQINAQSSTGPRTEADAIAAVAAMFLKKQKIKYSQPAIEPMSEAWKVSHTGGQPRLWQL